MKMKNKVNTNIRGIRSLHELHSEKLRLEEELRRTEEGINSNYRHILDAFSFRNILKMVTDDIAITTTVFSKAFAKGKKLFGKSKKKKKKILQPDPEEIKQISQPPDL
jgi:uncharacterized protein YydD (DUF2326 family)